MVDWPATLRPNRSGASESPPDNTMRSNMEIGPDKVRRRTTANIRPFMFNMLLDDVGVQTLDDFYTLTTASGSLPFNFVHPRTEETVEARFVQKPSYSYDETMARCSVSLEIMP